VTGRPDWLAYMSPVDWLLVIAGFSVAGIVAGIGIWREGKQPTAPQRRRKRVVVRPLPRIRYVRERCRSSDPHGRQRLIRSTKAHSPTTESWSIRATSKSQVISLTTDKIRRRLVRVWL
jgi:hypothetical protein